MLRPPRPPLLRPSFSLRRLTFFWSNFWITFWQLLGIILESLLGSKRRQKVDLFFERFLLALRRHFGRLLGRLGILLGRSVFPKYCKKQYKTMIFKIVLFRSRSSLGWLLDGLLADFGEVLGSKMNPKVAQKVIRNWTEKYTKNVLILGLKMEGTGAPFFHTFWGPNPRWPQDGPRRPQDDPRRPQDGPRQLQDGPRRPKTTPRLPQDGLKTAQERPKTSQVDPKTAPRRPKTAQDGPALPSLLRVIVSFLRCRLFHGNFR